MKEERIHELFREMRDEPVPDESLQNVQQAVTEKIRLQRSAQKRWGWAIGLAAAASLLIVALLWQSPKTNVKPKQAAIHSPAPEVRQPATPRPEVAQVEKKVPSVPLHQVKQKTFSKPEPQQIEAKKKPEDSIMIRVETEDPNVVILLVGE